MEHDFGFLKRDDSSSDPDTDFESYLKEKLTRWTPPSQQDETPLVSEQRDLLIQYPGLNQPVPAAEPSVPQVNSPAEGIDVPSSSSSVPAAVVDSKTELAVHGVEGHRYVVSHTEPVTVDSEWIRVRDESRRTAVLEMDAEACIRRVHDLNTLVYLSRAQQSGLNDAIEELLKAENDSKRQELIKLRSDLTTKSKRKVASDSGTSARKTSSSKKVGKTKVQKAVDQLVNMSFSQDKVTELIKAQGLLDASAEEYIRKAFGG